MVGLALRNNTTVMVIVAERLIVSKWVRIRRWFTINRPIENRWLVAIRRDSKAATVIERSMGRRRDSVVVQDDLISPEIVVRRVSARGSSHRVPGVNSQLGEGGRGKMAQGKAQGQPGIHLQSQGHGVSGPGRVLGLGSRYTLLGSKQSSTVGSVSGRVRDHMLKGLVDMLGQVGVADARLLRGWGIRPATTATSNGSATTAKHLGGRIQEKRGGDTETRGGDGDGDGDGDEDEDEGEGEGEDGGDGEDGGGEIGLVMGGDGVLGKQKRWQGVYQEDAVDAADNGKSTEQAV
ncbi:hypothetical protein TWF718_009995 [Orbilia javanica]|uniref:Uncharacterized protein n=1 Tax=Orbilia javanica TaxID=47235 RepID=A0AAN8MXU2_9PEZI